MAEKDRSSGVTLAASYIKESHCKLHRSVNQIDSNKTFHIEDQICYLLSYAGVCICVCVSSQREKRQLEESLEEIKEQEEEMSAMRCCTRCCTSCFLVLRLSCA